LGIAHDIFFTSVTTLLALWSVDAGAAGDMQLPMAPWTEENPVGELQLRIIQLQPGGTLELESGTYQGPIIVRTPGVTISGVAKKPDGTGGAKIDGGGKGSVIVVEASGVTIKNLAITGTGPSHDHVHAGISVRQQSNVLLRGNHITDALFGIDVGGSHDVTVENNFIDARNMPMMYRGDAIRVWNSSDIIVTGNHWSHSRDSVSWYSDRVRWENNRGEFSRYSMHTMYSRNLTARGNHFENNSVGIFLMYGEGFEIDGNTIVRSTGITGVGVGAKEASGINITGNRIIYCTTAILLDNSPWDSARPAVIRGNDLSFNGTAVSLAGDKPGARFEENTFLGNRLDADSDSRQASRTTWRGNRWDKYDGFDRNRDGIGDLPFRVVKYTDTLAASHPMAQYFFGAPVMMTIQLLEKLIPPTQPLVLLEDQNPRVFGRGKL